MNDQLEKARDTFIETAGNLAKSFGLSETAGRLYALLYLTEEPVSLNEMTDRLGISKASASVNMRALEGWGAARKVWVKGNRRDHYVVDRDVWRIAAERLKQGFERRMSEATGTMEEVEKLLKSSEKKLNGDDRKTARAYMERIENVREMGERLQTFLKLVPTNPI